MDLPVIAIIPSAGTASRMGFDNYNDDLITKTWIWKSSKAFP